MQAFTRGPEMTMPHMWHGAKNNKRMLIGPDIKKPSKRSDQGAIADAAVKKWYNIPLGDYLVAFFQMFHGEKNTLISHKMRMFLSSGAAFLLSFSIWVITTVLVLDPEKITMENPEDRVESHLPHPTGGGVDHGWSIGVGDIKLFATCTCTCDEFGQLVALLGGKCTGSDGDCAVDPSCVPKYYSYKDLALGAMIASLIMVIANMTRYFSSMTIFLLRVVMAIFFPAFCVVITALLVIVEIFLIFIVWPLHKLVSLLLHDIEPFNLGETIKYFFDWVYVGKAGTVADGTNPLIAAVKTQGLVVAVFNFILKYEKDTKSAKVLNVTRADGKTRLSQLDHERFHGTYYPLMNFLNILHNIAHFFVVVLACGIYSDVRHFEDDAFFGAGAALRAAGCIMKSDDSTPATIADFTSTNRDYGLALLCCVGLYTFFYRVVGTQLEGGEYGSR